MTLINSASLTMVRNSSWYCIHSKRAKEAWVARQLTEGCDEVYLPLLRHWRKIRRQFTWKIDALFPGYLFARFSVEERFRTVRYTSGVINVLSTITGEPLEVNEIIISALRERSENGYIQVPPTPFVPGEELEITEGPFRGLRALFQKEMKANERVAVLLDLLSSQVRVELPRAYVQKIASAAGERWVV